jgi:hypothetical protein
VPTSRFKPSTPGAPALALALAPVLALALAGCGGSRSGAGRRTGSSASVPSYVTEPFSHEEQLVAQGARLAVADGCTACHLTSGGKGIGPSFSSFAGHRVKLADGRSVVVDERYVREGLTDPAAAEIAGYEAAPMLAAVARSHLASRPSDVAALAAFIEQVGPEAQSGSE